jgi:ferrous iron transport protein B
MPTVVLIGNPNTGKSTLFGALAGIHQHVGNYPGVTVEKKTGRMSYGGQEYELIDLPGLYSLAARSRDEMVAVDVLLGRQADVGAVDAVLAIVDAGNLERNLYLLSQVLEFGLPVVVAVNMIDVAASRGITVHTERLAKSLGVPVVAVQANRGIGLDVLKAALPEAIRSGGRPIVPAFPSAFEQEVRRLGASLGGATVREPANPPSHRPHSTSHTPPAPPALSPALLRRLLLDASGWLQQALLPSGNGRLACELEAARSRLAAAGCAVPGIETTTRYAWAHAVLQGAIQEPQHYPATASDRIDHVLTHRLWGTAVFALVMTVVFQSVFVWARPIMGLIESATSAAGNWVEAAMAEGALRSLLVEGVVGGVGSVLIFLPQILVLFFFIALLEDCGYMARAAYLMDRVMARVGLSGRSFIPMLSSFACSVPGIMSARVIENERDRLTTILVAPLLTCSARLPVYALLIAAFIPAQTYLGGTLSLQGLTLAGLYALGIVAAVAVALVLKRTLLRGETPPFLLELPSYKWPSPRTVAMRVAQRAWVFLRTAGTLILAVSVIVWAALYYPHDREAVAPWVEQQQDIEARLERLSSDDPQHAQLTDELVQVRREIAAVYQQHSTLGWLGRKIEPLVKPLGWDWRIGCSVLASFPAREVVVATLGVVYGLGKDVDAESDDGLGQLQAKLRSATWDGTDRPVFTVPVALSIMVFFALCAQCAATLAVMRRETNSWRWPAFAFVYMTALAYVGAWVTYQLGTWLGA